ncbi:proline dehydrogenase family protein [Flavobacteriales bacterium]|nr:proline dehydrogenase family protein [Flavobacteriales bacterium]
MGNNKSSIFKNLEAGFASKSDGELRFSAFIFNLMASPFLVKVSTSIALVAVKLHLPISGLIKATIFKQFCGGESRSDSEKVIKKLGNHNVKSILDYSIEGENHDAQFESTTEEIIKVIQHGKSNDNIPVACVKITGIGSFQLLEKVNEKSTLNAQEAASFETIKTRLDRLCSAAQSNGVPLYIDAEESWIQDTIDELVMEMMLRYNTEKAFVFNTLQMYRWDRLSFFKESLKKAKENGIKLGVKIVRGAYIEKENDRAEQKGYRSPIQPSKDATDRDYNTALQFTIDNLDYIEICAGTHNEYSSELLTELMAKKGIANDHPHIYFSQLYGMSDQISFNLASLGYNVSKYVPYGPVNSTLPYLIRRAEENTSMAGQVGNELKLIRKEQKRRKSTAS